MRRERRTTRAVSAAVGSGKCAVDHGPLTTSHFYTDGYRFVAANANQILSKERESRSFALVRMTLSGDGARRTGFRERLDLGDLPRRAGADSFDPILRHDVVVLDSNAGVLVSRHDRFHARDVRAIARRVRECGQ